MENQELEKLRKFALNAYKMLPGNRDYALNDTALEGMAALAKAYMHGNDGVGTEKDFGKVLTELGEFVPGLFQEKPDAPPTLPEWPRHPLTNELLPNPWAPGHESLAAQSKIMARDPALAKAMKAAVENPWGYFFDLEEEKQKREHRAAFTYTTDDHKKNPHVTGDLKGQGDLQKRDPVLAGIYKREAQPVSLPFVPGNVNETVRGQLYTKAPKLYHWSENSRAMLEAWNAQRLAALKATEAQAKVEREQLEARLRREEAKTSRQPGELV